MVEDGAVDELFPPGKAQDPERISLIVEIAAKHMRRSIIYRAYLERSPEQVAAEKLYSNAYAEFLRNPNNHYQGGKRNGGKQVPKFGETRISFAPESAFVIALRAKDMLTVKLLCALGVPTSGELFEMLKNDSNLSGYATKLGDHMYKDLCLGNPSHAEKFATDGLASRSGKSR